MTPPSPRPPRKPALAAALRRARGLLAPALLALALWVAATHTGSSQATAAPVLALDQPTVQRIDLLPYLEYYTDPAGQLTLDDVTGMGAPDFVAATDSIPTAGFTPVTVWVRLHLRSEAAADADWMLVLNKPTLAYVDFYLLAEDGALLDEVNTGALLPFATRAVPHEEFVFPVSLPPGAQRTVLVRMVDTLPRPLRLTFYAPGAFVGWTSQRQLLWGAVYGILLMMAAYHLLLFTTLRERSYLLLVLYSLAAMASYAAVDGHGQRYLWPQRPDVLTWFLPLSIAAVGVFLLLLAAALLETGTRAPRLHRLIVGLAVAIALTVVVVPLLPLGTVVSIQYVLLVPTLLVVPWASVSVWRTGYRPARYFVIAQAIPLAIGLVTIVAQLAGLPLASEVRELSVPGNVLMVLFTSFALADRINVLQAEKRQALQELAASERRSAQYLEAIPVGVAVFTPDQRLVYVNRKALDLVGSTGAQMDSFPGSRPTYRFNVAGTDAAYPDERLPLLRALRGEASSVDNVDVVTPTRRFPASMWAAPVHDLDGRVEYAVTAFQDISAMRDAQRALAEAQALYRRVVEDQPALICRFRPDGTVTFLNSAMAEFFGYSHDEIVGANIFAYIAEELLEAQRSDLAALTAETPVLTTEYELRGADGQLHWMQWTVRALFDERAALSEYQVLGLDTTKAKQAEHELAEYRNQLEDLVAARTEALSRANTDLRRRAEELAALNAITQSLTSTADLPATLSEVATVVRRLFRAHTTSIRFFDARSGGQNVVGWTAAPDYRGPHPLHDQEVVNIARILDALAETKRALVIADPAGSPLYDDAGRAVLAGSGVQGMMCVPLLARGEVLGSIILSTAEPGRQFTRAEMDLAETIAAPLAAAFDTSVVLRREQHQRAVAESLQQIAQALNSSLEVDVVLHEVLAQLGHVVPYGGAEVLLEENGALTVAAAGGPNQHAPLEQPARGDGSAAAQVFRDRRPLVQAGWMGAPLMVGSEPIGVLAVTAAQGGVYRERDAQLLQAFADQAAIAVLNARLFQQTHAVAASKERERLARELHDAVTQTLFSASILAEALPVQWQSDAEGARVTLDKLRQLTRGALAEMRTLLLELRPGALTEVGLDNLLRHLGEAMTGSTLVPVFLKADAPDLRLPAEVQIAFYRIAQEALNNIAKHADATSVEIVLQGSAADVTLSICDDGEGFDASVAAPGHLGLAIMRERAQAVGATLTIDSEPGGGTQLTLRRTAAQ
jgi:PAS domain S-box-containing protein